MNMQLYCGSLGGSSGRIWQKKILSLNASAVTITDQSPATCGSLAIDNRVKLVLIECENHL